MASALALFKIPPLIPILSDAWGRPPESLGILQTAFGIGGVLTGVLMIIKVISKLSLKKIGILSGLLVITGAGINSIFTSYTGILIGRIIEGAAFGICMTFPVGIIAKWFPEEERGTALGIWSPFAPVGALIIFLSASHLISIDWVWVMWLVFSWAAISTLLFAFLTRMSRKNPDNPSKTLDTRSLLLNRNIWLVGIVWLFYNYFLISFSSFMPTYFNEVVELSVGTASRVAIIPVAMQIWSAPTWGIISDRVKSLNLRKMLLIGTFLSFLLVMIIPFLPPSLLYWIIFLLALGFIWSAIPPACFASYVEIAGQKNSKISVAVLNLLVSISIIVSPSITEFLISGMGWTFGIVSTGSFMILGTVAAAYAKIS